MWARPVRFAGYGYSKRYQSGPAPDIYRGTVTYSTSPASVRTVNVTLIVAPVTSSIPLGSVGPQPYCSHVLPGASLVPT